MAQLNAGNSTQIPTFGAGTYGPLGGFSAALAAGIAKESAQGNQAVVNNGVITAQPAPKTYTPLTNDTANKPLTAPGGGALPLNAQVAQGGATGGSVLGSGSQGTGGGLAGQTAGSANNPSGNPNLSSQKLYANYATAIQQAGQMGQQNLQDISNESGAIQQGYNAAQQQAQYQQDLMARKSAAMSALMGGSAGGGAAQAGSAQAALSGEQLQYQAAQNFAQQKVQQAQNMVGARQAMINNQMQIAQQSMGAATTEDQQQQAQAIMINLTQQQNMVSMLNSMVQAGTITDAQGVMNALNKFQGSMGGPNSFPTA